MQRNLLFLGAAMTATTLCARAQNTFPSSGNVGIGTTSPQRKLHIVDAVDRGGGYFKPLVAYNPSLAAGQHVQLALGRANSNYNQGEINFNLVGGAGSTSNSLSFGLYGKPTIMTLQGTGNVGIGTNSPAQKLHVVGNGTFTGNVGIGTASPDYSLDVQTSAAIVQLQSSAGNAGIIANKFSSSQSSFVIHQTDGIAKWLEGTNSDDNFALVNYNYGGNALTVDVNNNNVAIGTSIPANRLLVTNNTVPGATARIENLYGSTNYDDGLYIVAGTNEGTSVPSFFIGFRKPNDDVIGSVSQTGATSVGYFTTSDKRLKRNIQETRFGLADLNKIEVKDYNFVGEQRKQTGFLAQQLYEIFPEAVSVGGDDPKSRPWMVDYGRITPLLVKAVQELDVKTKEIDKLKEQVVELRNMLLEIKNSRSNAANMSSASLEAPVPNPTKGSALIRYSLPEEATNAKLSLVNAKGQLVKSIGVSGKGAGQINLDTTSLPSGTYTYTLWVNGQQSASKQLVIAR